MVVPDVRRDSGNPPRAQFRSRYRAEPPNATHCRSSESLRSPGSGRIRSLTIGEMLHAGRLRRLLNQVADEIGARVGHNHNIDVACSSQIRQAVARQVAAGIRRRATTYGYSGPERAGADECARYLDNKQDYLGYATALKKGWPVATGVIEGACRHR